MHYCYILRCTYGTKSDKATYNGYTNNLERRIRQHRGEIKGGAKCTARYPGAWEYIAQITSDSPNFNKIKALSCEWSIRYPTNKRPRPKEYNSPSGRIKGLNLVFANPKFSDLHFTVKVLSEYMHLIDPRPNVTVASLD